MNWRELDGTARSHGLAVNWHELAGTECVCVCARAVAILAWRAWRGTNQNRTRNLLLVRIASQYANEQTKQEQTGCDIQFSFPSKVGVVLNGPKTPISVDDFECMTSLRLSERPNNGGKLVQK